MYVSQDNFWVYGFVGEWLGYYVYGFIYGLVWFLRFIPYFPGFYVDWIWFWIWGLLEISFGCWVEHEERVLKFLRKNNEIRFKVCFFNLI